MTRKIPAIEGIPGERLQSLFKEALGGHPTQATSEEMLALAATALRAIGERVPNKVMITTVVKCYKSPATVLSFRRP